MSDPLRDRLGEKRAKRRRVRPPEEQPETPQPPLVTQGARSAMPRGPEPSPDEAIRRAVFELRESSRWTRL